MLEALREFTMVHAMIAASYYHFLCASKYNSSSPAIMFALSTNMRYRSIAFWLSSCFD